MRARDAIDGRVTFAIAAFVATGGLIVLLDRVGVSERFIAAIGPTVALIGLGLIGLLLRTMRISGFYAASRVTPPAYAGSNSISSAPAVAFVASIASRSEIPSPPSSAISAATEATSPLTASEELLTTTTSSAR